MVLPQQQGKVQFGAFMSESVHYCFAYIGPWHGEKLKALKSSLIHNLLRIHVLIGWLLFLSLSYWQFHTREWFLGVMFLQQPSFILSSIWKCIIILFFSGILPPSNLQWMHALFVLQQMIWVHTGLFFFCPFCSHGIIIPYLPPKPFLSFFLF